MLIVDKGRTPDGIDIVQEDWSKDYPSIKYKHVVTAYPIAKASLGGYFMPEKGKRFRCAFEFETLEEAAKVYLRLLNGIITIYDLKKYLVRPELEEIM